MARLTVVRNKTEMSAAAAERVTSLVESAIGSRGSAAICLTGGSTTDQLYEFLADSARPWRGRIDWMHVHLFWGDERNVPPDRPDSNFGLANRTLIRHVRIPAANVHRIRGELAAVDAGRKYDAVLRAARDRRSGYLFDVVLFGIGANAHIASVFPDSPLLAAWHSSTPGQPGRDGPPWSAGVWVPQLNEWRITLTPPALLSSDAIVVIAVGPQKAEAMAAAIAAPPDLAHYPAQLLRDAGDRVEWIADKAAARLVSL